MKWLDNCLFDISGNWMYCLGTDWIFPSLIWFPLSLETEPG